MYFVKNLQLSRASKGAGIYTLSQNNCAFMRSMRKDLAVFGRCRAVELHAVPFDGCNERAKDNQIAGFGRTNMLDVDDSADRCFAGFEI